MTSNILHYIVCGKKLMGKVCVRATDPRDAIRVATGDKNLKLVQIPATESSKADYYTALAENDRRASIRYYKVEKSASNNWNKELFLITFKKEPAYDEYDNGVEIAGIVSKGNEYEAVKEVENWLAKNGYAEGVAMCNRLRLDALDFYDFSKKF